MSVTAGYTSSAAEEIAQCLSGAQVVNAFNTVFAALLADRAGGGAVAVPVFVADDHEAATQSVADLTREMGFTTILAGPISSTRYLEPMAGLMI